MFTICPCQDFRVKFRQEQRDKNMLHLIFPRYSLDEIPNSKFQTRSIIDLVSIKLVNILNHIYAYVKKKKKNRQKQ